MPLYNNILLSRKNDGQESGETSTKKNSANSAGMKLLQDHLLSKRRSQQQNVTTSKYASQKDTNKSQHNEYKSSQIISESELHLPSENDWELEDEYDPRFPNNYEVLQSDYLKAEELRLAALKCSSSMTKKMIPNLLDVLDKFDEVDGDISYEDTKTNKGTAIAPPQSLLNTRLDDDSGERSEKRVKFNHDTSANESSEKLDGSSVAAKIMSKMGYKVGQGLGKDEQGISAPLEVEKSGLNSGRILLVPKVVTHKDPETCRVAKAAPSTDNTSMAQVLRESTRVLLLQNMVGPGEVDVELEAETKEECKKYGDVVKCLIYEIPNKRVPDEEAVRIFVEFRHVESAIKAASDLDGRYFGGRVVRASFYNQDKFNKFELGP